MSKPKYQQDGEATWTETNQCVTKKDKKCSSEHNTSKCALIDLAKTVKKMG